MVWIILVLQITTQLLPFIIQLLQHKQQYIGSPNLPPNVSSEFVGKVEGQIYTKDMAREDNIKAIHEKFPTLPEPVIRIVHELAYATCIKSIDTRHWTTWLLNMKAFAGWDDTPKNDDDLTQSYIDLGKKTMGG